MRRPLTNILGKKSIQTIALFAAFAAMATQLPAPWWEGDVLAIFPELPDPSGRFVEAPRTNQEVKQEVATVDLDQQKTATWRRSPQLSSTPRRSTASGAPPGPTSAGSDVPQSRPAARAAPPKRRLPSLADLRLHEKIQTLDDKLEEPPTDLRRPCLAWYPPPAVPGFRPLCRRRALDDFFKQLRDVAVGKASRPARFTQFGDSLVAGDAFTGELRRLLQEQFGRGGFGWVHAGKASAHIGTRHLTVDTSSAWRAEDMIWQPRSDFKLGLAGVAFHPRGNPSLGLYPHDEGYGRIFDRIGVVYYRRSRTSRIHLKIGGEQRTIDLSGEPGTNAVRWISVEKGAHDVRLAGFDPTTYVYGVLLEQSGPGVVVDNLGLSSARAPRLRFVDPEQWQAQIRTRSPDAVSFAYGVNSAGKRKASDAWLEDYRNHYRKILETARTASDDVGCLVVGLLTRGALENGEIEIYDSVRPLVRHQREAANRAHCAFWNAFEAMGGAAGAERWYENRPQLLGSDLAHPTRSGYRKLANLFYASLIDEFRRYMDERLRRASIPRFPELREDDGPRASNTEIDTVFAAN